MDNSYKTIPTNLPILTIIPEHCPFCNHDISLNCVFSCQSKTGRVYVFLCPRTECQAVFFTRWDDGKVMTYPAEANMNEISAKIATISPNFYEIYRQSNLAENSGLNMICGMGYRRAAEFLVKDYLVTFGNLGKSKEEIYKMGFSSAIHKLPDQQLIDISKASSWLGNDETHTFKKWSDYDVQNLKSFIQSLAAYTVFKMNAGIANQLIHSKDNQ